MSIYQKKIGTPKSNFFRVDDVNGIFTFCLNSKKTNDFISVSPGINAGTLREHLGSWAVKLKDIGIVDESMEYNVKASDTSSLMDSGDSPRSILELTLFLVGDLDLINDYCRIVELARFGAEVSSTN